MVVLDWTMGWMEGTVRLRLGGQMWRTRGGKEIL